MISVKGSCFFRFYCFVFIGFLGFIMICLFTVNTSFNISNDISGALYHAFWLRSFVTLWGQKSQVEHHQTSWSLPVDQETLYNLYMIIHMSQRVYLWMGDGWWLPMSFAMKILGKGFNMFYAVPFLWCQIMISNLIQTFCLSISAVPLMGRTSRCPHWRRLEVVKRTFRAGWKRWVDISYDRDD